MPRRSCRCSLPLLLALVTLAGRPARAGKWVNSYAGPYIATAGRIETCPETESEHLVRVSLKVSQFRSPVELQHKLQTLTGNVTVKIPLDEKGSSVMKVASRSNNQWKENAFLFKVPGGICKSTMEIFPDFVRQVYKMEPITKGPCLIPKGVYMVDAAPINWTFPKVTVFPYGTYRFEVWYLLGPEPKPRNIMCFRAVITVHPKL